MTDQYQTERATDLERRIRIYEQMEQEEHWPGALRASDYTAITLLTLGLITVFYLWGY